MRRYILVILSFFALVSCAKEQFSQEVKTEKPADEIARAERGVRPNTVIVRFSDEMMGRIESDLNKGKIITKSMELNQAADQYGIVSMERLFPEGGEFEARARKAGLHKWYRITYDSSRPATKAAPEFSAIKGVEYSETERKIKLLAFDDPYMGNQWGFFGEQTDINVQAVWDHYTTGDPKVIVAVVDGGVDLEHPDLKWNCIPGGPDGSRNFAENTYDIDPDSHGTHVAGTVAAVNNNGTGVCGTAGGDFKADKKGVRIMSCQFFGVNGYNGSSSAALRWACDHGAVIAQNSWGYDFDYDNNGYLDEDETRDALNATIDGSTQAAVDYFINNAGCDAEGKQKPDSPMKGGLVVFAAGNDGLANGAPANYDRVVAVGAVQSNGNKASFSNYGDWVDICAPGVSIYSTVPGSYSNMNGTSMACPHVSGVAALVVSQHGKQGFTADMLRERLLKGANPDKVNTTIVGPFLDALGAITYGQTDPPAKIADYTITPKANNLEFKWNATADAEGKTVYGATLLASKDQALLTGIDPDAIPEGVVAKEVVTQDLAIGSEVLGHIEGLDFETQYFVCLVPHTYMSVYGEVSAVKPVKTTKNTPPTVLVNYDGELSFAAWKSVVLPIELYDADGHKVSFVGEDFYTAGSAADKLGKSTLTGKYQITVDCPKAEAGTYAANLKISDGYETVDAKVEYTILANRAPEVKKPIENHRFTKPNESFKLIVAEHFADPDEEHLTYQVSSVPSGAVHYNRSGDDIIISSLANGLAQVTVTVLDAKKAQASSTFSVLTRDPSVETVSYPNPVKDYLYISTGNEEQDCNIRLVAEGGALVYEGTQISSAFKPAQVDMSKCSPGLYALTYIYGGKTYKKTIVKR